MSPGVFVRLKGKNVKNLSLEQIQRTILWIYGKFLPGESRSPSFLSVKCREKLRSVNLVFVGEQSFLSKGACAQLTHLLCDNAKKKDVVLRECLSLEKLKKLVVKSIDRSKIEWQQCALNRGNVEAFLMKEPDLALYRYQRTVPSNVSLLSMVDCSDFTTFSSETGHFLVAVDCEMVETVLGHEIGRVSVVDSQGSTLYDTFVRPRGRVVDFLTEHSGLDQRILELGANFEDMRGNLARIIGKNTIILGHSLENDLSALKVHHTKLIDTSHIYLSKENKRLRLQELVLKYVGRYTQRGEHCSLEDARSCLGLLKCRVAEMEMLEQSSETLAVPQINYFSVPKTDCQASEDMEINSSEFRNFLDCQSLNLISLSYRGFEKFLVQASEFQTCVFLYFYETDMSVHMVF